MFKSITILYAVLICVSIVRGNLDERYRPRPPPPPPQYLGTVYNANAASANNDGLIDEFGQCGGLEYEGPKTCRSSLICVKRSKYYAQCLTSEAAAVATLPTPQAIAPGGKCHGGNIRGPAVCAIGTACFIQTENVHGECRTFCPQGWFCTKQTLPEWAPCGGDAYVGLTKCKEGLQCVAHSKWYHECRSECPEGWKC